MDVLVVDDDPDIRHMLSFSLEGHGLSVRTAADGDAALVHILADPPRCVVLDLMMPELDGFGVLARLQERADPGAPKVLVLSCRSDEAAQARAAELGADGYLVKPVDPDLLAARIVAVAGLTAAP